MKEKLIRVREEEEKTNKTGKNMFGEEGETETSLMFRFPTYEEFVGKKDGNFDQKDRNLSSDQVSDEDSDDEFFDAVSEDDEDLNDNFIQVERNIGRQINSERVFSDDIGVSVEETGKYNHVGSDMGNNSEKVKIIAKENPRSQSMDDPKTESYEMNHVGSDDVVENLEQVNVEDEEERPSQCMNDSSAKTGHLFSSDDDDESDSDSDSMVSSGKFSLRSSIMDSPSDDGFLSDIDFERAFEFDSSMKFDDVEAYLSKKMSLEEEEEEEEEEQEQEDDDMELEKLNKGYETDDFEDEDEEIIKELMKLEAAENEKKQPQPPKRRVSFKEPIVEMNQNDDEELSSVEQNDEKASSKSSSVEQNDENPSSKGEESSSKPSSSSGEQLSSDSEEQSELERQWEHQDLVEQLKMEIKKVRAIGLPTILEESESPKIAQDLKPWKIHIQDKFHRQDTLDELHKFYKTYRERMRKLDILNYQKMYAIGFLRQKDPLQSLTRSKMSTPGVAAIVSLDCWSSCKGKSSVDINEPVMKRFSKELENDLELVYVGQMCLSWEFLRWEYSKALKLWDTDLHGIRLYNEVADKFQQFQVLLTRFLEDEPFQQAPRVLHYVKTRCVLRNLLQVPVIREDNLRDKRKDRKWASSKDAITSVKLVETIEESIRVLWQFIRSDKATHNAVLNKCRSNSNVELQNPADAVVLEELRATLQKKEKRLKELIKSENCLLRKIQKHQHEDENGSHDVMYFFSQVDLKLVSRVLNMSKLTTEQLVWCSDKLSKINVVGGKLYVDPLFLLFPCS